MTLSAQLALALCLSATAARALPIDCTRTSTPDENTICSDPFLVQLDARMDTLYDISGRFVSDKDASALRDSQRAWVKDRQACGADKNCIRSAYAARNAVFEKILARVQAKGPF